MQHAVALELKLENSPSVVAHEGQLWGQDIQRSLISFLGPLEIGLSLLCSKL